MMWFNKMVASILPFMPKGLVWIFSKRYIAGKTIEDAIQVSKNLNQEGYMVTIDLLGEFITELHQAEQNRDKYLEIIEKVESSGIDGNYSLKPTMFGQIHSLTTCLLVSR